MLRHPVGPPPPPEYQTQPICTGSVSGVTWTAWKVGVSAAESYEKTCQRCQRVVSLTSSGYWSESRVPRNDIAMRPSSWLVMPAKAAEVTPGGLTRHGPSQVKNWSELRVR